LNAYPIRRINDSEIEKTVRKLAHSREAIAIKSDVHTQLLPKAARKSSTLQP
jgi:hypothetical protein